MFRSVWPEFNNSLPIIRPNELNRTMAGKHQTSHSINYESHCILETLVSKKIAAKYANPQGLKNHPCKLDQVKHEGVDKKDSKGEARKPNISEFYIKFPPRLP